MADRYMTTVRNNRQQLEVKRGRGKKKQQSATIRISNIFTQVTAESHIHIHTSMSKHFLKSSDHFKIIIQNHHGYYQYMYTVFTPSRSKVKRLG